MNIKTINTIRVVLLFVINIFFSIRMVSLYGLVRGLEYSFIAFMVGCALGVSIIIIVNYYTKSKCNKTLDK